MHFQKQDLESPHYNWSIDNKQLYVGQPGRRQFDRSDGNQVLFLINFYGALSEQFSISEGKKMEQKILHDLPEDARSEIAAFNWIRRTDLYS